MDRADMRVPVIVLVLLAVAPAVAQAQEHAHSKENGVAYVLHDGPDDGRAVVGAYTHFGFALLSKDAAPVPHQDAQFLVTQAGAVLFSTADTHEYDGVFGFDVRFTRPGPYEVTATSGDMEVGVFRGEAIFPVNATEATVLLTATPQGPASRLVDFEITIVDAAGELIPHTDAIVELRAARDGFLLGRTHLHIHDEPILFTQALGPDTEYVAQVVAYQAFNGGRVPDVPAVVAEFPVAVGPVAPPAAPMPDLAPPSPLEQVGPTGSADGLSLHLMFDPNQQVGLGQIGRIAAVVVEEMNHSTKPHVDFAMTLSGPRGLVFESANGHEYDGVFEYLFRPDAPGFYDGTITATYDATELTVPIHVVVVPPAIPLLGGTGLVDVTVDGLDGLRAGEEAALTFLATSAAGPAKHSEVDVTIYQDGEAPLYQFKIHTHDSGETNAAVVLPHEGVWKLRVDPFPTVPEASLYPPALFAFDVAAGAAEGTPVGEIAASSDPKLTVPTMAPLLGLACAVLAALVRKRT